MSLRLRLLAAALLGFALLTAGCTNFPANKPTAVEKQPAQKQVAP